MLFAANLAVEQEVIVAAIQIALLIYTNTRSIEAEQQVCSKTPIPVVGLTKFAHV